MDGGLGKGAKVAPAGGWEAAELTFTRFGEVWRDVLQLQAVIELTEGGIILHLSRNVMAISVEARDVLSDGSLDFPFAVFSKPPS